MLGGVTWPTGINANLCMGAGRVSSSSRSVGQNIGEMIVVSSKASPVSALWYDRSA